LDRGHQLLRYCLGVVALDGNDRDLARLAVFADREVDVDVGARARDNRFVEVQGRRPAKHRRMGRKELSIEFVDTRCSTSVEYACA
jgi:hypothetical protein